MSDLRQDIDPLNAPYEPHYGKYRGKVVENDDPLMLGRILANVAAVPDMTENWCMPCVPYAGAGVGFYAIPPIGANVWIEFEGGDVNYPIWSGCFWAPDETPTGKEPLGGEETPPEPGVKVFKTAFATVVLNDTPEVGGVVIECTPPAVDVPLSITFNALGITISAPPALIKMITEEGITLTYPPDVIAMTEGTIEVTVPPGTVTVTSAAVEVEAPLIDATAEGAVAITGGGDVAVEATGAIALSAVADINLAAAAAISTEAAADISLTAATVLINGATEIDPALLVDGMVPMLVG
jgi:hypothetical protein